MSPTGSGRVPAKRGAVSSPGNNLERRLQKHQKTYSYTQLTIKESAQAPGQNSIGTGGQY